MSMSQLDKIEELECLLQNMESLMTARMEGGKFIPSSDLDALLKMELLVSLVKTDKHKEFFEKAAELTRSNELHLN